IILTGYTPTPLDRFGRERKDLHKVALGAQKSVAWEYIKNPYGAIKKLKEERYTVAAVEQDKNSTLLFDFKPPKNKPLALVLGNEVKGLSKALLKKCDTTIEIPMKGKKESLNVSVAAGVVLFALLN